MASKIVPKAVLRRVSCPNQRCKVYFEDVPREHAAKVACSDHIKRAKTYPKSKMVALLNAGEFKIVKP